MGTHYVVLVASDNVIYRLSSLPLSLSPLSLSSSSASPSSSASTCNVLRVTSNPIVSSSEDTSSALPGAVTTTATEEVESKRGRKCFWSTLSTSAL